MILFAILKIAATYRGNFGNGTVTCRRVVGNDIATYSVIIGNGTATYPALQIDRVKLGIDDGIDPEPAVQRVLFGGDVAAAGEHAQRPRQGFEMATDKGCQAGMAGIAADAIGAETVVGGKRDQHPKIFAVERLVTDRPRRHRRVGLLRSGCHLAGLAFQALMLPTMVQPAEPINIERPVVVAMMSLGHKCAALCARHLND
ncbi:hypothetical protein NKH54_14030 [Mesorhizobium sp. M1004]